MDLRLYMLVVSGLLTSFLIHFYQRFTFLPYFLVTIFSCAEGLTEQALSFARFRRAPIFYIKWPYLEVL